MDTNALNELVEGILAIFNTQVIRIVLYGSYARETNTSESDVDIALLLNGNLNENTEDKLSDLVVDLNLKYDKVFSVIDIDYAVQMCIRDRVCYGYNQEEAMEEASRCLNCKNAKCIQGCPVSINIQEFVAKVKDGDIEGAYKVIGESSALPAICGRVCPQESQCESKCIRGIKRCV